MRSLSEVQVDANALRENLAALRQLAGTGTGVVAVVKGNAYGHGLGEVVRSLSDTAVDAFQVDDLEELAELRRFTDQRALVLGYVAKADIAELLALGGEPAVYDVGRLAVLDLQPCRVHLKIDALLGRQGVLPRDLAALLEQLTRYPNIEVATAYAHFANIEDTTDLVHAQEQIDVFEECFAVCREAYPRIGRHLSATSGLLTVEADNNLVRVGIGLYGMYPSVSLARRHSGLGLKPVMRWVSHLAQVKTLPARHPVGYGLTFVTSRETRIGIVPQGYADGYDRGLSNVGEVLVHGRRCPVLGRIAMNMFAIDLTAAPEAAPEDEVVLLGSQGDDQITAEEIAAKIGTINYEVTTRISPSIPRYTPPATTPA